MATNIGEADSRWRRSQEVDHLSVCLGVERPRSGRCEPKRKRGSSGYHVYRRYIQPCWLAEVEGYFTTLANTQKIFKRESPAAISGWIMPLEVQCWPLNATALSDSCWPTPLPVITQVSLTALAKVNGAPCRSA